MNIAVVSDTHNNHESVERALSIISNREISMIIHCGDITRPDTMELFNGHQVAFALGNGDADYGGLKQTAGSLSPQCTVAPFHELELDGVSLGVAHGHTETLDRLISGGTHQFVFCGHSHRRRHDSIDGTTVINPGALGGLNAQSRSFCILDLGTGTVDFVEL